MALLQSMARLYGAIRCLYILSSLFPSKTAGSIRTIQYYYYVGETITLHCYADSKFVDLRFTYANDIEVPMKYVTVISDTYARMDRPAMAEDNARTTFVCWSDFNEAVDVDTQTVETEYRPQKVTNLTCIYDNMQDALCSWNLAAQYKIIYYVEVTTHWRATPDESWKDCTNSSMTSCNITNCTQPVLYIRVSVTNKRRRDSVTTEFPVIKLKNYVKTSPVSNLQATNLNSTCIFLSWKLAHSNVRYHINYSRNDAHHISYNQSNACYHGFNITSERNITVCSLCPSRNYTFVVRTKPVKFGFFSDLALVSLQTQEDVPASGPQVTMGGYYREPCSSGDQDVLIYFQPVPEEERNGIIINYNVAVKDRENRTKEYVFNNSENSFSFNITVPCNQGFNASLYANTLVGSSPPSIFSVPAIKKVPITEAIDFAIQKNAGAFKTALWDPPEDSRVNTIFVHYCKSLPKPSKQCMTPMQHVVASASAGKQMLNSSDADIFGISQVSADNVTTGIHFTDCIFTPGSEAVKTPVEPVIETLSMTTVRVKLNYEYCDNNVLTYGYQIFVCQVEKASECFTQNVNRGSTLAVNVTNLKADTKYSFSFVSNTSSGLSERSEAVYYSLPTLKKYESSLSVTVVSSVICTLALFIIIVVAVIYHKRGKNISVVMKKRNNSQIAVNSRTEEHEIPDIDPLDDNASRVYSEIRDSFLDVQNQDIDYLSIINETIDDQLNHPQAIYYEIPDNQSTIGGHLTSGKQDYLHACFGTSEDTRAAKPYYLHPIELSQIDDDKQDYLHECFHSSQDTGAAKPYCLHPIELSQIVDDKQDYLHVCFDTSQDTGENKPYYLHAIELSQIDDDKQDYLHECFHSSQDTGGDKPYYLHPIELSQIDDDKQDYLHECSHTSQDTGGDKPHYLHPIELSQMDDDKLEYLHLHHESNSDEERPVYQQLRHDFNNGPEVLHNTEMSQTGGDRLDCSSLHQVIKRGQSTNNLFTICTTDVKNV